ncbi:hypothetical protein [Streptomyces showdoensis]|uniref:Uncharacterized protein n=1 Tax=Streptomyces showdoensis TaxID=68268 RepID=A0A2P2GU54_STREW|nr:hypothetical protein [Streptomyces showdoensis]KKZ75034.1 hypothetical protein VO63_04275 [Streptomyces showdoensis]
MLIDGYEDAPLTTREDLLSLPGFWPAYLLWLCRTGDEEPRPGWFGADEADTDAAIEALTDGERWPVFRIPFGAGHSVVVVGRNLADDTGTDYFVTHGEWERHGHLASVDGHHAGPGLAWRELVHIAATPDLDAPGVHTHHARLLLLLPVLGDADLPPEAAWLVADALLQAGVGDDEAPGLAEALLEEHPLWESPEWTLAGASPLSGGEDPFPGILYCDDPHSPRCDTRLARGITRDQSARLARALGTWPAVWGEGHNGPGLVG